MVHLVARRRFEDVKALRWQHAPQGVGAEGASSDRQSRDHRAGNAEGSSGRTHCCFHATARSIGELPPGRLGRHRSRSSANGPSFRYGSAIASPECVWTA
jgi:hypothetical protein